MEAISTTIRYIVKSDAFEPQFSKGQIVEAVLTADKIPFGHAVLIKWYNKIFFGWYYPSKRRGFFALMDNFRQITYIKNYSKIKFFKVKINE